MGLFKKLISTAITHYSDSAQDKSFQNSIVDNPKWWQPISGFNHYDTPDSSDYYRSFAYACINKGAINFAKAKPLVYRDQRNKKVEVEEHPLLRVFKRLNIYEQSFPEILYLSYVDMKMNGNAYWHVPTVNLPFEKQYGNKIVSEIIPLMAQYVKPVLNRKNTLIEKYEYGYGSEVINFLPEEIIHFKYSDRKNYLVGLSPVSRFNFTLDIDYMQGFFNRKMLKNDAKFKGILTFPENVDPAERKRLETTFNKEYNNADKGTLALTGGATYQRTQITPKEMDNRESRLAIRDEICVILDVPKTVMNISDDVNYNNSKSGLRSFTENCLQPFALTFMIPKIDAYFKNIYGDRFLFNMEWEFTTDRESQLETLKFYADSGKFTDNEIREIEGFESISDPRADTIYKQDFSNKENENEPATE